jgi:endonuclease YncB( thermonuclease family)
MRRSLTGWFVVAAAVAGLATPQFIDARGSSGSRSSGGSKSSGSYLYKAPAKAKSSSGTTSRSSTRSLSGYKPTFKASRYVSSNTARSFRAAPLKTPKYWVGGASHVVSGPIRVHDGDTFYADGKRIRLRGIDTPELGQPRSFAAQQRLDQLLRSGTVTIEPRAIDKYGRTVGVVMVNGHDVAAILRAEGYSK